MDIGKALTYITEDPRWKEKIAIGTGVVILSSILSVVLIGIVGFFIVAGYCVRLLQNVRDGQPYPLPEWDQWGDDLVRGLKWAVVLLVWALPAILFSIPVALGGALSEGRGAGAFVGTTILFGGMCLLMLYSLFLAVAQASFTIAYARDEKISSGLQVREIWDWTMANIGQLVIVALAYIVASIGISLVASIVGTLLCIIGLIVTIPLAQLVIYLFQFHLYGQLASAYPYPSAGSDRPDWTPPPAPAASATTAPDAPVGPIVPTGSTIDDNPYAAYGPATESSAATVTEFPTESATEFVTEPPVEGSLDDTISAATGVESSELVESSTGESDLGYTGLAEPAVSDDTPSAVESSDPTVPPTEDALAAATATGATSAPEVTGDDEISYPDSGVEDESASERTHDQDATETDDSDGRDKDKT